MSVSARSVCSLNSCCWSSAGMRSLVWGKWSIRIAGTGSLVTVAEMEMEMGVVPRGGGGLKRGRCMWERSVGLVRGGAMLMRFLVVQLGGVG